MVHHWNEMDGPPPEYTSGVGEGGAGGATAPPLLKVGGGGGGGHCPPLLDIIAP